MDNAAKIVIKQIKLAANVVNIIILIVLEHVKRVQVISLIVIKKKIILLMYAPTIAEYAQLKAKLVVNVMFACIITS